MTTKFLAERLWSRIRAVGRDAGPHFVAVPFVSTGAVRRLPLKRGDLLVTRCNRETVECGQTNPRDIALFIRRGVSVHSVASLHAKVYASTKRCVIASANLSNESENRLVEAGVESTNRRLVSDASRFVESLSGEIVELEFAEALIKYYKPPKRPNAGARKATRTRVRHSDIWIISVHVVDYSDEDEAAAEAGEREAVRRGADERVQRLERISLPARGKSPRFGERVLQVDGTERVRKVIPPARVMSVRRYRTTRGGARLMLTVTVPKGTRQIPLRRIVQKLGASARVLGEIGQGQLTDPQLAVAVATLWPDRPVRRRRRS